METTKNKLTPYEKDFFDKLRNYIDKPIYFYGSIQRDDYLPQASDIDIDIFSNYTRNLFQSMCIFCYVNDINIESILDTNIEKLKARYGEKFSSDRAINRDLEKERMILEK